MIPLKEVIFELNTIQYNELSQKLLDTKAEKFSVLLSISRENNLPDKQVMQKLEVNESAFYALKSRLYDKIQEYLLDHFHLNDPSLNNSTSIADLLYSTPKYIAISALTKLESILKEKDLPYELSSIYGALRKLHIHSPKYYEYAQLYNRHLAYMLAIDKAEDLLSTFILKLEEYRLSRKPDLVDVMLMIRNEMVNTCRLYESHHLTIYNGIIDLSIRLFTDSKKNLTESFSAEDTLKTCYQIISKHPNDRIYQKLKLVFDFLSHEYYLQINEQKKAEQYFQIIDDNLPEFILYNHTTLSSIFLLRKLEKRKDDPSSPIHTTLNEEILFSEDDEDKFNQVHSSLFKAGNFYLEKKYPEASSILFDLSNRLTFKEIPFAEIEIKLFLALTYILSEKAELATSLIRSVSRKVKELDQQDAMENISEFIKILNVATGNQSEQIKRTKISQSVRLFTILNTGTNKILGFINTDESFIKALVYS